MKDNISPVTASPVSKNMMSNRKLHLVIGLVVIVIGILATVAYYSLSRPAAEKSVDFGPQTTEEIKIDNPIQYFYKNFEAKDYHVKVSSSQREPYSFYFEKGVLVRMHGEGRYNSEPTVIFKNGKFYSINNKKKVFSEKNVNDPTYSATLSQYYIDFIFDRIRQGDTQNAPQWSFVRRDPVNSRLAEFITTGRKEAPKFPGHTRFIDIRVLIDTDSGLIPSLSYKYQGSTEWFPFEFHYEEIENIEPLKRFPLEYKKMN